MGWRDRGGGGGPRGCTLSRSRWGAGCARLRRLLPRKPAQLRLQTCMRQAGAEGTDQWQHYLS